MTSNWLRRDSLFHSLRTDTRLRLIHWISLSWVLIHVDDVQYLEVQATLDLCYGHNSSTGTVQRLYHKKSYDSTAPVRRPVGGRNYRTIFGHFCRHRTVPGEVYVLLKIPQRTYICSVFCRVIEGKITSARTAPGQRLQTSDGHRTIFVSNLNRTISTATVRVLTSINLNSFSSHRNV